MRRIIYLLLIGLIVATISGCDKGLEIISMEIEKYPNRIVYYSGIDKDIDLTGGVVKYYTKDGTSTSEDIADRFNTISYDIDFNTPGVYVVEIQRGKFICKYPVQVID
jgi:hypothetical protein